MSKKTVLEPEETEDSEPLTVAELMTYAIQDAVAGESAENLTDIFIDEFISQNREETPQILMFLDMPNETIVEMLIQTQMQAIEMLKQNAPKFLDELRNSINVRLAEMAKTANSN